MDRIGRPKPLKGASPAEHLLKVPILRGWDGKPEAEAWMTVGSGRKLEAVKRRQGQLPEMSGEVEEAWAQWEDLLSKEYVQYARGTHFIRFLCPHCSSHI